MTGVIAGTTAFGGLAGLAATAASGYAGVNHYGVLLTDNTNTVPANTMTALKNLGVKTIQPVGGTAAISSAQLAALSAAGYNVMPSLAGPTSLATMEAINDTIPPSSVGMSGTGGPLAPGPSRRPSWPRLMRTT
ncbi:MAG: hypothetical protein ACYCTI_02615 [Acidimicrobiales bacterium]